MQIAPALMQQIVDHAQRDAPDECCGVVFCRDGVAEAVHELENLAASPLRFEVDGMALHRLMTAAEDEGAQLGVIYHSHTRSEPRPSQTDINFAAGWPGVEWLIVGTAGSEPEVRSFLISADGAIEEVPLT